MEQRQYKKVHWKRRDSVGEMKEIGSTMVESSALFRRDLFEFANEWDICYFHLFG